ncbi:MAG: DNA repair protein RecO [Patescibacteria group bacterium]|jgi:DNA repair protein RecO (recombination protein O)
MPNQLRVRAVVLKGTNFGEADRILTVLTDRLGKIKVMAKGIRKIKSHLAGALEPFMLVDLQLHEGKTFYIVTGAAIERPFHSLHENFGKVGQAFYFGELVDRFIEERQKIPEIFQLFENGLEQIEIGIRSIVLRGFELKIVEYAGFKPELNNCVHCKEKIAPGENFWDSVEGGIICTNCQKIHHHGERIGDEAVKLLHFFERSDLGTISRLKLAESAEKEVEKILANYVGSILERELKSKIFLIK